MFCFPPTVGAIRSVVDPTIYRWSCGGVELEVCHILQIIEINLEVVSNLQNHGDSSPVGLPPSDQINKE